VVLPDGPRWRLVHHSKPIPTWWGIDGHETQDPANALEFVTEGGAHRYRDRVLREFAGSWVVEQIAAHRRTA
jgi:hypothetical protein